MSKHSSEVTHVLVNVGDQTILADGSLVGNLAVGQFGVFNELGVARDGVSAVEGEPFFIATTLADGTVVRTDMITATGIRSVSVVCASAAVQQVIDITDICADCASDYSVRLDINHPAAWHTYGFQPFLKTFTASTACCGSAGTASCTELVRSLRNEINADTEALVTASARNPVGLAELNDAALDAWDEGVSGCPVLRIAVNALADPAFNSIPYKHVYPELVTVTATVSGFSCCSPATTVANSTAPVIAEGDGSLVRYEEYQYASNMNNGGRYPITQSGVVFDRQYNGVAATTYSSVTIEYDEPVSAGFQRHDSPKAVRLWIPTAAANTEDNLGNILDVLAPGYGIDTALSACD